MDLSYVVKSPADTGQQPAGSKDALVLMRTDHVTCSKFDDLTSSHSTSFPFDFSSSSPPSPPPPTQPSIPCPSLLLHITFQLIQDSSHFCYVDFHDCLVAHSWKPDNSFDLVTISHNSPPRSSAFLLRNIIPFHFR